jgi:hypothetical protein
MVVGSAGVVSLEATARYATTRHEYRHILCGQGYILVSLAVAIGAYNQENGRDCCC